MKIVFTSDTHGKLPYVPQCDLLCIVGDMLLDLHPKDEEMEKRWILLFFLPWIQEMRNRGIKVLIVPGNHDRLFEQQETQDYIKQYVDYFLNWEAVTINGFVFLGCPSHSLPDRPFYKTEQEKYRLLSKFKKCDFFLTHEPAYGIMDSTNEGYKIGSDAILSYLKKLEPTMHICGHNHSGFGYYWGSFRYSMGSLLKTHCINVSYSVDPHYKLEHHSLVMYDTETDSYDILEDEKCT